MMSLELEKKIEVQLVLYGPVYTVAQKTVPMFGHFENIDLP